MADREQIVEHEKAVSPLSDREIEEADERSSTSAKVVHEAIRLEGTEELERPSSSICWSGLAAGLTMGCSMLGQGLLQASLPDAPWRDLVASFGYCLGFLFVTMGRQQLFTETTLTVMLPVLHKTHGIGDVARYWAIVFAANIVATLLFAAAAHPGTVPARSGARLHRARRQGGRARVRHGAPESGVRRLADRADGLADAGRGLREVRRHHCRDLADLSR